MGKQSSINVAKQSSSSRMGTNMSRESKTDSADGLFSLGLENNFLTIVHCSITNILAELKKNFDKTELEEQHSKMMELFMNSCTMAGGFPFDVKFDAFSLMIPGHNQAGKAAQFAMRINDKMKDFNKKFIIENRIPLYIHIGIACSDCLCGNVGSSSSKHFAGIFFVSFIQFVKLINYFSIMFQLLGLPLINLRFWPIAQKKFLKPTKNNK